MITPSVAAVSVAERVSPCGGNTERRSPTGPPASLLRRRSPPARGDLRVCSLALYTTITVIALFATQSCTGAEAASDVGGARCASCSQRGFEEYKLLRQEQILSELLKKLDLPAKPNITVDFENLPPLGRHSPRVKALIEQSIRENAQQQYRRVRKSTRSHGGANTDPNHHHLHEGEQVFPELYEIGEQVAPPQISFIMAEAAQPSRLRPQYYDDVWAEETAVFKFSANQRSKYVNKATLNVFLRRPRRREVLMRIPVRLEVFQRFPNGSLGPRIATAHEEVDTDSPRTALRLELDALDVQQWLQEDVDGAQEGTTPTMSLYVQAVHGNENLVIFPSEEEPSHSMFIELELYDYGSGRSRRHADNVCRPGANETKCCLYELTIDFERAGWEFVIAPKRYNAYICSGSCTATQMSSSPRGTIAQQANLDYYQCCHPKEYAGITIVYVTENNHIWIKEIPGMVAKKCGCA